MNIQDLIKQYLPQLTKYLSDWFAKPEDPVKIAIREQLRKEAEAQAEREKAP